MTKNDNSYPQTPQKTDDAGSSGRLVPSPKLVTNPVSKLSPNEILWIQSNTVNFITKDGEQKQMAYGWLKGAWKNPRPGKPKTFCFVGLQTYNYLKISHPKLTGIFEALWLKSQIIEAACKNFTIYDNSTPVGQDPVVYSMTEKGIYTHKQKLDAYLNFRII